MPESGLGGEKKFQLRLNIINRGVYRTFDIKPSWDSFYITGVEPGLSYYCDISIKEDNGENYPIIYSNTLSTPQEQPGTVKTVGSNFWGAGEFDIYNGTWPSYRSGVFLRKPDMY